MSDALRRPGIHPLDSVDLLNIRPGLRRWIAPNADIGDHLIWRESWISIHYDGSVTLAAEVGGHRRNSDEYFEGREVEASTIEYAVADLMALIRATAAATHNDEYDVRVGIEWNGEQPLTILTKDTLGHAYDHGSTPLHHYAPIETTLNALEPDVDFHWHVHDLAQDCVNQGGISNLLMIHPPDATNRHTRECDSHRHGSSGGRTRSDRVTSSLMRRGGPSHLTMAQEWKHE